MTILKLVEENSPILKTIAARYIFSDYEVGHAEQLATDMYETMIAGNGIGLAAPQIGLSLRVLVLATEPIRAMFNPKITWFSEEKAEIVEGCLSFPGLGIPVERSTGIRVRYQDINGNAVVEKFNGISARCVQHEIEHLDGICFTEKVSKLKLDTAIKKRKKLMKAAAEHNDSADNTIQI